MDTKALKQKILDLAIRGKLVPQDPNDEPASVLLEKIRAEKQQMVKDGMLKSKDLKNDTVIFVGEDNLHYEKFSDGTIECIEKEIPYALPKNWKWCRLYQLTEAIPDAMADGPFGSNLKKEHYTNNQEVRIIQLSNIGENGWENHNKKYTTYSHASTLARSCVQQGTIVIAKMMPAGRAIIVPNIENNYILSSDVIKFVPHKKLNKEYLICALNSTTFLSQVAFGAHGVTRIRTSLSKLKEYLVPVPPLPEQNRIVSLFKSANSNIGTIINEKEALLDLLKITKSKILDLAIRGKLVPQDPNDEPASVLLERIRQEKEELIQAGKIKRDKNESIIFRGDDNSYYLRTGKLVEPLTDWSFDDLPKNWEICCFGEICNYGDCINTESSVIENSAWILDLEDIEKDTGRIVSRVSKADRPSISTKHKFHKGQVLYSKLRPYLNKVVLADRDGYCTSEILPLEFHAEIIPEYARYYLMSPTFLRYADKCSYGVKMPRLGTNDGKKAIFPLPPINEQRRIVKQIELMFSHLSGIEISVQ